MPNINPGVRAKAGWIETKRRAKGGRIVPARDHVVTSQGMHSAKEMEKEMIAIARDVGASEDQIRISTFEHGKAPIEANPRHRGLTGERIGGMKGRVFAGFNPKTDG